MSDAAQHHLMACPHCQSHLRVPAASFGTRSMCPRCGKQVTIPSQIKPSQIKPPAVAGESPPVEKREAAESAASDSRADGPRKSHARDEFALVCRLCGSRLYARPEQIGRALECPDCRAVNEVRGPEERMARKLFDTEEDYELRLAEDDQPPDPQYQGLYPVTCRVCETAIHCRPDQQGQSLICPDCSSVIVVPPPRPKKKKLVLTDDGEPIEIAPTFDRPTEKSNADKLLSTAAAKVAAEEARRPKPPQRPFQDAIWSFPFHLRVLPAWIVISLLASVTLEVFKLGVSLAQEQGLGSVLGIIVMAPLGLLGLLWMLLTANVMMTIVHWTAMGYRTIEDWPAFDIWEWVRKILFFVNSMCVCCFPGFLISLVLPFPMIFLPCSAALIFVLFPFVFLSMLDAESPTGVYSEYVWSTTRSLRAAWRTFYVKTLFVVLGVASVHLLSALARNLFFEHASVAATMMGAVVYFRLLGRLAWLLDEHHATLPVEDEEDEPRDNSRPFSLGQSAGA